MKTIEVTYMDGSKAVQKSDKKMTKSAILNAVKELLEQGDVKEIKIAQ